MSIKKLLANSYNNGNHIPITLELSKSMQLEDIFTIIYLMTAKNCELQIDKSFRMIIYPYNMCKLNVANIIRHYIEISDTGLSEINIQIIGMLCMIIYSEKNNLEISHNYQKIVYNDTKKFIETAISMDIINHPKVKYIMNVYNINTNVEYMVQPEYTDLHVQNYLELLSNTKSARKN